MRGRDASAAATCALGRGGVRAPGVVVLAWLDLDEGVVEQALRVLVEALAQLAVFDEQPQRLDVQPLLHRHLRISLTPISHGQQISPSRRIFTTLLEPLPLPPSARWSILYEDLATPIPALPPLT